jgi:hypothetical protein
VEGSPTDVAVNPKENPVTEKQQLPWHKRLNDFESFDKITLDVVPRYKTSGLSGDEWRQHVEVTFWFKGEKVHAAGFGKMHAALMMLGAEWIKAQEPIPERVIEIERDRCDQPSCTEKAVGRFKLKKLTSARGEFLADREGGHAGYFRQFCRKHLRRGDCGLEDCDTNYEPLDGITAVDSTNTETSPSRTVVLDARDETMASPRVKPGIA